VLIVDDDTIIRETLRWLLEDGGYQVTEAPDGEQALAILRASDQPLVVLLDLMMPHVNGQEVIETIAADQQLATRHAYVVVTANAHLLSAAFRDRLTTLAIPLVAKPFDLDLLYEAVAKAAGRLPQA
jgi:CheY-like chemotaxis protein